MSALFLRVMLLILLTSFLVYATYIYVKGYYLLEPFVATDPVLHKLQSQLVKIHPKFDNISLHADNKSFTINKKKVHICTHKENGQYYDENTLVYVLCHELTHVLSDTVENDTDTHSPAFFALFRQVLKRATELGMYDPKKGITPNYCGYST